MRMPNVARNCEIRSVSPMSRQIDSFHRKRIGDSTTIESGQKKAARDQIGNDLRNTNGGFGRWTPNFTEPG
jgi:hypothetical protein